MLSVSKSQVTSTVQYGHDVVSTTERELLKESEVIGHSGAPPERNESCVFQKCLFVLSTGVHPKYRPSKILDVPSIQSTQVSTADDAECFRIPSIDTLNYSYPYSILS